MENFNEINPSEPSVMRDVKSVIFYLNFCEDIQILNDSANKRMFSCTQRITERTELLIIRTKGNCF